MFIILCGIIGIVSICMPLFLCLLLIFLIWNINKIPEWIRAVISIMILTIGFNMTFNNFNTDEKDNNEVGTEYVNSKEKNDDESYNYDDYRLNELIKCYNKIAEYQINENDFEKINSLDRPISTATITFDNGVYVIAKYNNYNHTIFIDYQEEGNDDTNIYPIFRDFVKSTISIITDEEVEIAWIELQSGNYQYYTEYDLCGIKCTYSTQLLTNGKKRYYLKTSCDD